jgi:hypothetical protein
MITPLRRFASRQTGYNSSMLSIFVQLVLAAVIAALAWWLDTDDDRHYTPA